MKMVEVTHLLTVFLSPHAGLRMILNGQTCMFTKVCPPSLPSSLPPFLPPSLPPFFLSALPCVSPALSPIAPSLPPSLPPFLPLQEYDPTRLTTDVAGKLARCLVPDGAHLKKGEPFAEVEVMKM